MRLAVHSCESFTKRLLLVNDHQMLLDDVQACGNRSQHALHQIDSFDELFISERDGQPLTVAYGPAAANSNFIVSEQTGVNGKRMVGLRTGIVEEMDEAQYKALTGPKR